MNCFETFEFLILFTRFVLEIAMIVSSCFYCSFGRYVIFQVSVSHPDPAFEQFDVFQDVVRQLMDGAVVRSGLFDYAA